MHTILPGNEFKNLLNLQCTQHENCFMLLGRKMQESAYLSKSLKIRDPYKGGHQPECHKAFRIDITEIRRENETGKRSRFQCLETMS